MWPAVKLQFRVTVITEEPKILHPRVRGARVRIMRRPRHKTRVPTLNQHPGPCGTGSALRPQAQ